MLNQTDKLRKSWSKRRSLREEPYTQNFRRALLRGHVCSLYIAEMGVVGRRPPTQVAAGPPLLDTWQLGV